MTVIFSVCGLFVEILALSQVQIESWGDYYNTARLILWLGVAGLAIRDFIGKKGFQTLKQSLEKHIKSLSSHVNELEATGEEQLEALQKQEEMVRTYEEKVKTLEEQLSQLKQSHETLQTQNQKLEQQNRQLKSNDASSAATMLLSTLQSKGRFLDFVMSEISSYPDAQVGAAARIVHQGCQKVLDQYFAIKPVREDKEGSLINLGDSPNAKHYRLVGSGSEQLPSSARLVHKGWRTDKVELPKYLNDKDTDKNILAPAEIRI